MCVLINSRRVNKRWNPPLKHKHKASIDGHNMGTASATFTYICRVYHSGLMFHNNITRYKNIQLFWSTTLSDFTTQSMWVCCPICFDANRIQISFWVITSFTWELLIERQSVEIREQPHHYVALWGHGVEIYANQWGQLMFQWTSGTDSPPDALIGLK